MIKNMLAVALVVVTSITIADDDRVDHFEGKKATSVAQAHMLLKTYNDKLQALKEKETLAATDLGEIHLATYTLENQIAYLIADLQKMAESLEELHLTSETGDISKTEDKLDKYLEHAKKHDSKKH